MARFLSDRLFQAWMALCAVTAVSLVLGAGGGGSLAGHAVLAIAFAKAGVVMFVFMDLHGAPRALRMTAFAWLALVLAALLAILSGWAG